MEQTGTADAGNDGEGVSAEMASGEKREQDLDDGRPSAAIANVSVPVERLDVAVASGHAVELDGVLTKADVAVLTAAANAAVTAAGAIAEDVIAAAGPVAVDAENDGADFAGAAEGVDSVTDAVVVRTVVAVATESAG